MIRRLIRNSLASLLLIVVIGNLVSTFEVRKNYEGCIHNLNIELRTARQDIARLENENSALVVEAMSWMTKHKQITFFLEDMEPDIKTIAGLSDCVNCCDVGEKLVLFGPRLQYFKGQIRHFIEVKYGRE